MMLLLVEGCVAEMPLAFRPVSSSPIGSNVFMSVPSWSALPFLLPSGEFPLVVDVAAVLAIVVAAMRES